MTIDRRKIYRSKKSEKVLPKETTPEEIDKVFEALATSVNEAEAKILEVDGVDIVEVPPEEPQPPYLTKDELYKLQIAQLTVRAAEAELNLKMLQRDLLVKQIDPEGKLKILAALIRSHGDEAALGKRDYAQVTKDIEDRLKITLKEWAYNDENGLLQKVE